MSFFTQFPLNIDHASLAFDAPITIFRILVAASDISASFQPMRDCTVVLRLIHPCNDFWRREGFDLIKRNSWRFTELLEDIQHDLGEADQFQLYETLKTLAAAPPGILNPESSPCRS